MNLYDLLRSTHFQGVSFDLIRKFARQILVALQYFAQPEVDIIHCDLKPENILLVEPKRSALKVIDFGSSCTAKEKPYTYIQSRFYRSPEVILQCGYTTAIDMWSLGCILIEMHSGEPLFSGQNEKEQMHLLVGSRGMPPEEMLREGKKVPTFFDVVEDNSTNPPTRQWRLRELKDRPQPNPRPLKPQTIEQALGIAPHSESQTPFLRQTKHKKESLERYQEFADLLNRMLCYSPAARITPEQALAHPFLVMTNPPTSATAGGAYNGNGEGSNRKTATRREPPKRPFSQ
jgi:dual specificity tyrosine-phosphorylation-regulated kinase 1